MKRPLPLSVLSLDVGRKRVGLAGCDPLGISVTTLPPLIRQDLKTDINTLKIICEARKIKGLIIGLPLDEKGHRTQQSTFCQNYGFKVARLLKLPIAWVNEYGSTIEARNIYGLSKDRSGQLDSASAAILLEQWLREGPELEPVDTASYGEHNMETDARC